MAKVNKSARLALEIMAENLFYVFPRTSMHFLSIFVVLGYINITLASSWISPMFIFLWPNFSLHKKPVVLE